MRSPSKTLFVAMLVAVVMSGCATTYTNQPTRVASATLAPAKPTTCVREFRDGEGGVQERGVNCPPTSATSPDSDVASDPPWVMWATPLPQKNMPKGQEGYLSVGCSTKPCWVWIDGRAFSRKYNGKEEILRTPIYNILLKEGFHDVKVQEVNKEECGKVVRVWVAKGVYIRIFFWPEHWSKDCGFVPTPLVPPQ